MRGALAVGDIRRWCGCLGALVAVYSPSELCCVVLVDRTGLERVSSYPRWDTGVMKRERAQDLVTNVLRALHDGQEEWPISLLSELYVFGSFARGALDPHDVDIDIEFESDEEWRLHFIGCLSYGKDPHSPIRRALTRGKRGIQFQFNFRDRADFELTLLWRRGDTLQAALTRLHAIQADSAAGRAPRHAMLPQFEGLDEWIPRPYREALAEAASNGALNIERCVVSEDAVTSDRARDHLAERWPPTSPLYRAASAVIAHWEQRGIDPGQGHLHGKDIRDRDTPYFAGFKWRYFTSIPACLTRYGGVEWLEIVRPTRTKPLDAFLILPGDRDLLSEIHW